MKTWNFIQNILVEEMQFPIMCDRVASEILNYYKDEKRISVITVLEGGSYFSDCVSRSPLFSEPDAFNLAKYHFKISAKSYINNIKSEFMCDIDIDSKYIKDNHVLIVDDIHDTGETLAKIDESIKKMNPKSVEHCVMVYRNKQSDIKPKFIGITVYCDDFLVGAGLDYKEFFRDLPYIGTLKKGFDGEVKSTYEEHICNKCGNKFSYGGDNPGDGIIEMKANHFSLKKEFDHKGFTKFDLCPLCLKNFTDSFKISVYGLEAIRP